MKTIFEPDLGKQHIFANGDELAQIMGMDRAADGKKVYSYPEDNSVHVVTFEDPILMTDHYRAGLLDPVMRDTVITLLNSNKRIVEYENTKLRFDQDRYSQLWSPSIDTLLFCRALHECDLKDKKKAIEIGSGSGFISKYIINNSEGLESMTLIDINPHAKDCAIDNIKDERAIFITGDALNYLNGNKYDLIVCNPPYIPRQDSIDDNPYEGVNLINYLIDNSDRLLTKKGSIITNISSLSGDIVMEAIERKRLNCNILDSMQVPLKVFNVYHNKAWRDFLVEEKGMIDEIKNGYRYWHDINILKLEKKQCLNYC